MTAVILLVVIGIAWEVMFAGHYQFPCTPNTGVTPMMPWMFWGWGMWIFPVIGLIVFPFVIYFVFTRIFPGGGPVGVTALDYSEEGLKWLAARAEEVGVAAHVATRGFDIRQMLPFPDGSFDACYSHMLLCMELLMEELKFLVGEIHRVLRPGGLALYSVPTGIPIPGTI